MTKKQKITKTLKIIAVVLFVALMAAYGIVSAVLAKSMALPKTLSYDEEIAWVKERGLWGDADSYETVDYQVKGYEGYTLNCKFVKGKNPDSKNYVIISHGFRSNVNGAIKYVDAYRNMGYSCIIYDVRGHGNNEKVPCTLGNRESDDLLLLIEDTYSRYGDDIYLGLHGESMGSAISLSLLGKTQNLRFVVADCGFSNLYGLIRNAYRGNHLGVLIHGVNAMTQLRYDFDMRDTNPIGALENNKIPICFIHGSDDIFITKEHSELMADINQSYDELHIIEGASHANSKKRLGTKAYQEILENFLDKIP